MNKLMPAVIFTVVCVFLNVHFCQVQEKTTNS